MFHFKEQPKPFSHLSKITERLEILLIEPAHQTQYTKNYELLHEEFKKHLSSTLTLEDLKRLHACINRQKYSKQFNLYL